MARLSVAANATPKAEHKSSRLRGIFKPRSGSSASSSPATLQKLPPSAGSSPLSSPDVRQGFQQVGLLPSERSMHSLQQLDENDLGPGETAGFAAVEESGLVSKSEVTTPKTHRGSTDLGATRSYGVPALAKLQTEHQLRKRGSFAQSFRDAFSKQPVEASGPEAVESEVAVSQDVSPRALDNANTRSSLPPSPSHKIVKAMYNKNNNSVVDTSNVASDSFRASTDNPNSIHIGGSTGDLSVDQYKSLSIKRTNDFLKTTRMPLQTSPASMTANKYENATTILKEDGDSSPRKSFASNIFDDDSALSQGIREYVTSKIAEAVIEHKRGRADDGDLRLSPLLHLTIKVDAAGLAKAKSSTDSIISEEMAYIFAESTTIGPFHITNARLAMDLQIGTTAIYAVILLGASILGPKSLLLTVWRLVIVLGLYAAVLRYLGWNENFERDVLLAPVSFATSVATGMGEQALDQMRVVMVAVLVEAFERVAQGCGVQVRTE